MRAVRAQGLLVQSTPGRVWTLTGLSPQALLPLALEGTDVGQTKAAQALAKLTITSNPEMTFPGERVRVFLPQPWPLPLPGPRWPLTWAVAPPWDQEEVAALLSPRGWEGSLLSGWTPTCGVRGSVGLGRVALTGTCIPQVYEVVRPLVSLLHLHCSGLQNFEALMALTNLAGISERLRSVPLGRAAWAGGGIRV